MPILEVYADESCKNGHRYLALGGIAIEETHKQEVLEAFAALRASRNAWAEIKWSSFRPSRLNMYKEFVDIFFEFAAEDKLHFHALYVDTTLADPGTFNEASGQLGFDKLIYQLLLHKFGRKYGADYNIHVYLDERDCNQQPETIRPMLNTALVQHKILTEPFRRIRFVESKQSDLIQLADVLIGCLATRKNGHHKRLGACKEKRALGDHIAIKAHRLEKALNLEGRYARRFTIWPFAYYKKTGFLRT